MVKGKKHLCSTFQIRKYFKAFQGIFEIDSNWYSRLEKSVVENHIDDKYQDFLAQPVVESDIIKWFAKFDETAIRLTELVGDEREKYEQLKDKTLAHYKSVVRSLEQQGKSNEAEYLQKSIKYIDDRFVYCFEDKVVLGVWGMQLRNNLKEPFGTGEIAKSIFVPKKANPELIQQPESEKNVDEEFVSENEPEPPTEEEAPSAYTVRFISGENGTVDGGEKEFQKNQGETISENEIPKINAESGYDSNGWDENPKDYIVDGDKNFTAQYKRWPWYKRLWHWFKNGGWKWLLGLLLLLLLILLLLRGCTNEEHVHPLPADVHNKPWVETDPRSGKGGIYNPGDPYGERPATPPEYQEVLPPSEGVLAPIDSTQIVQEPDKPTIIGNRLNILMGDEGRDIKDLAKAFKEKYPEDKYKVVYYDNVVKRMQIELPSDEREKLKGEIPEKLPEYELFVFDESLFSGNYTPNDPDFDDADKAWYLNAIEAPKAWEINRGTGSVTIAIVDNGFSLNHPEFQAKVVMPYNVWLHSSNVFPQKVDHGTHVAGTALALMDNGIGLCGIAPDVAFMPVQVADENGITTTTSVLDGILYALYQGADVINLSMGMEFPGTFPPEVQEQLKHQFKPEERLWREVMRIANKHNAVIVIAAGNNNMLAEVDPINRPENFVVVSAVDRNQAQLEKTVFSDYGRLSTISAPGVDIYSTVGYQGFEIMSGTSMAAPIIAGSAALMKSLNDTLTVQQIVCAMQSTGIPTAGDVGNFLQLDEALKKVVEADFHNCEPEPPSPSSGDVQVLLSWENYNDLDLICVDPFGDYIWFENKKVESLGQLEIDMNVEPQSNNPVENIFWPDGQAPNGTYNVYVLYYKHHQNKATLETSFEVKIKYGDEIENVSGVMNQVEEKIHVATFTLGSVTDAQVPSAPSSGDSRVSQLEDQKRQLQRQLERIDKELEQLKNLAKNK
jgi:subtilisin family serine protease